MQLRAALLGLLTIALFASGCATAGEAGPDDTADSSSDTPDAADVDDIDAAHVELIDGSPGAIDASAPGPIDASLPPAIDAAVPPPMIDASVPPTCTTCKLVAQTCCAQNQACDLVDFLGGTSCRAVSPLPGGTETATCSASGTCAAGYGCYGPTTAERTCKRYCASDAQCAGGGNAGGKCLLEVTAAGGASIPNSEHPQNRTYTCSPNCDPQSATGCPSGFACEVGTIDAPIANTWRDFTDCRKAGTKTQDQTCTSINDCAAGFTCANDGTANYCLKYCKVGASSTGCPLLYSCVQINGEDNTAFTIAGTTWGVCY